MNRSTPRYVVTIVRAATGLTGRSTILGRGQTTMRIKRISYGSTAAIVTGMALITGLSGVGSAKTTIISTLLIAALADNLTDSLSIHIYQESEHLNGRDAFIGTLSNFATRLLLSLSFIVIVMFVPPKGVVYGAVAWGLVLLAVLTCLIARERKAPIFSEIVKHLGIAVAVLAISKSIAYVLS